MRPPGLTSGHRASIVAPAVPPVARCRFRVWFFICQPMLTHHAGAGAGRIEQDAVSGFAVPPLSARRRVTRVGSTRTSAARPSRARFSAIRWQRWASISSAVSWQSASSRTCAVLPGSTGVQHPHAILHGAVAANCARRRPAPRTSRRGSPADAHRPWPLEHQHAFRQRFGVNLACGKRFQQL